MAMEFEYITTAIKPLTGGCSCGRNKYTITIPSTTTERIQVYFDSGHAQRRHHASPLSAWLRVPLDWFHSTTYPVLDDETQASIKRVYSPIPSEQRIFCGYCGTPLSHWTELNNESQHISLTLGSLSGSDLRDLEEMGALPKEAVKKAEGDKKLVNELGPSTLIGSDSIPWFEKIIEGSNLGLMRRTGLRKEENGKTVEWEIVEWTNGDESKLGKRKIGDVEGDLIGE